MVKLLMNVETSSEGKGPIGVERCTSWGGPMHGNPLHVHRRLHVVKKLIVRGGL